MRFYKILCLCLILCQLQACWPNTKIEESPSEQMKAETLAKRFIQKHSQKDLNTLLQLTAFPFIKNGQIYLNRTQLKVALELKTKLPHQTIQVKKRHLHSFDTLFLDFGSYGNMKPFLNKSIYVLILEHTRPPSSDTQIISFFMKKENGQWRVVGVSEY